MLNKNNLKGMVYGHVVGDALGVPVEFNKRDTYNIKGMTGYGTYDQPKGTWSDDSSLSLCLMEHLNKETSLNNLMDSFVMYSDEGYMTPFDECFDVGNTTIKAIENRKYLNKDAVECGSKDISSNGNGSLMRIAPIIVKTNELNKVSDKLELVKKYSSLSHAHELSVLSCLIYILCLEEIINGTDKISILDNVYLNLLKLLDNHRDYLILLDEYYLDLFDEGFKYHSKDYIKSDGYVVHTLIASLWCFLNASDFCEGVLMAVNLGEDTDTVGAITGSLLGAYYGYDSIKKDWIDSIQNKELVDGVVVRYVNKFVRN